jgi:hypothetical protein
MDSDWKIDIMRMSRRESDYERSEFMRLVDMTWQHGDCDIDTIRILMHTYRDFEDFETQEAVEAALSRADPRDHITAILEELPRLLRDAPSWVETIIGQQVDRHPELIGSIASTMSDESKGSSAMHT